MSQPVLFGPHPKPIDFPYLAFKVTWRCDDKECKNHTMNLHSWDIHELARKYIRDPQRIEKVEEAMRKMLNLEKYDLFLFLGNFRTVQVNFGLMSAISIVKPEIKSPTLFDK